MEAKMSFTDEGASMSRNQTMGKPEDTSTAQVTVPLLLASFLKICMKLLRDQKLVEGLQ